VFHSPASQTPVWEAIGFLGDLGDLVVHISSASQTPVWEAELKELKSI